MPVSGGDAVAYHEESRSLASDDNQVKPEADSADHPAIIDSAPDLRLVGSGLLSEFLREKRESILLMDYRKNCSPRGRSSSPLKKGRDPSPSPQLGKLL